MKYYSVGKKKFLNVPVHCLFEIVVPDGTTRKLTEIGGFDTKSLNFVLRRVRALKEVGNRLLSTGHLRVPNT